jgi:pimeloyl-ACP methyl ester carboxylesterase
MPDFRMIDASGARIRAVVKGEGPLVLMVHGFPESWYSYRHQIDPVAAAGFTACAIDMRGYGGSQKFGKVADYDTEATIRDVLGVADALSPDRGVILVGHDWGAPTVYNAALLHPDRFVALATMSVVYNGAPERDFAVVIRELFDDHGRFFYQSYFREPGVAEAAFDPDPRAFLTKFYYAISGDAKPGTWPMNKTSADALLDILPEPPGFGPWMTDADMDYYVGEFTRSGFFGPLSRYRNHTRDFHFLQRTKGRTIDQPAFFIAGDKDGAFNMFNAAVDPLVNMRRFVTRLEGGHVLPGCGHWTQQEKPREVNALLVPWLESLKGRVV